jgi:hypothetical protein
MESDANFARDLPHGARLRPESRRALTRSNALRNKFALDRVIPPPQVIPSPPVPSPSSGEARTREESLSPSPAQRERVGVRVGVRVSFHFERAPRGGSG